jgi:hypothetical protein
MLHCLGWPVVLIVSVICFAAGGLPANAQSPPAASRGWLAGPGFAGFAPSDAGHGSFPAGALQSSGLPYAKSISRLAAPPQYGGARYYGGRYFSNQHFTHSHSARYEQRAFNGSTYSARR